MGFLDMSMLFWPIFVILTLYVIHLALKTKFLEWQCKKAEQQYIDEWPEVSERIRAKSEELHQWVEEHYCEPFPYERLSEIPSEARSEIREEKAQQKRENSFWYKLRNRKRD